MIQQTGIATVNYRETSQQSRDALIRSGRANRYREAIFDFIVGHGGATCDEVEVALGLRHQTASSLINHLFKNGRIREAFGEGATRKTRSGRSAIVWVEAKPTVQPELFGSAATIAEKRVFFG